MASKKEDHGKVLDLTTRVLLEIRDEARRTNAQLGETNAQLGETNARLDVTIARLDTLTVRVETGLSQVNTRLDQLSARMETGFAQVNARLDNFIEIAGDRYRDLDARVRVLEARSQ